MTDRYLTNFDLGNYDFECDVAIIGSGIAGLYTSLMLGKDTRVLVVSKSEITKSNSYLAQGGIAASMLEDEAISHIEDTIVAGCNHNDLQAVTRMIYESRENIDELIKLNVPFDRKKDGTIHMTKEGGHSTSRILHVLDKTGEGITESLIYHARKRENITIFENTYCVDVISSGIGDDEGSGGKCACGLVLLKDGNIRTIKSKAVVIASGGIGKLYTGTTNAENSTGDGIGIAKRIGAAFRDMEFIQFHPTAHVHENDDKTTTTLLISEAVRGEGAKLVNSLGEYFMENVHPMKELAPRNVVAAHILDQMNKGRDVFLDLRHLDGEYIRGRFPNIYSKMMDFGIDITKELVKVTPVQHYFMGGIEVDLFGRTTVSGLYACGEASNTGVHGANRLASNSLLEAIVYGRRIAHDIDKKMSSNSFPVVHIEKSFISNKEKAEITDELSYSVARMIKDIMTGSASIVRDIKALEDARDKIGSLDRLMNTANCDTVAKCEAVNMITAASLILDAAIMRKTTLGTHIVK